jgi:TolB-like protein/tetratricopeptide (TPR) repeat protein
MGAETPNQVATAARAVFLSYASQDTEAAQEICEALRAAGIEVWFDQSELRGGDAWDQSIRKQIKTCALFLPLVSKHTHERAEGYFRLEWKLAVDRSHLIMANKPFLVPVVIDDTPDDDENVPEKFREMHWTRLPAGQTPQEFVTRIHELLSGESGHSATLARTSAPLSPGRLSRLNPARLAGAIVVAALAAYLLAEKPWTVKPAAPSKPATPPDTPNAFNPPPHSIAVLPFVNLSGDPNQQYFSDGLTEELLNSLSRINELQVAARASSFSFQGEHPDLATVAHKLNVASVLEGSVRRSGHTIRVTAQLNNATTGFHIWSHTYDRDLVDVLQLQTEIATTVASALKITLLGTAAARIELGGTRDPAALDAYLRANSAHLNGARDQSVAIAAYSQAIHFDPNYALAFAGRSTAHSIAAAWLTGEAKRKERDQAKADARQSVVLAPELAEAHLALAVLSEDSLDFAQATTEYERALALAPGSARVLRDYGVFAVDMGRTDAGIAAVRGAAVLDPLNPAVRGRLGTALIYARRYEEALTAYQEFINLDPGYSLGYPSRGLAYYFLGDLQGARASCEAKPDLVPSRFCLASTYEKLGRHADALAMLAKVQAENGDALAYYYAGVQAQWGNVAKALEWLETAYRLRDPNLGLLKVDPFVDPLRQEPRFLAIERELKFPE